MRDERLGALEYDIENCPRSGELLKAPKTLSRTFIAVAIKNQFQSHNGSQDYVSEPPETPLNRIAGFGNELIEALFSDGTTSVRVDVDALRLAEARRQVSREPDQFAVLRRAEDEMQIAGAKAEGDFTCRPTERRFLPADDPCAT